MNTDTPECNALWEKGWNHTRLWELSQKLERERDALKALLTKKQGAVTISRNGYVQKLERERDEAREQLEKIEAKMRLELGGHPNSELWGETGLIAATMRCVDALGEITDLQPIKI